MTDLHFGLPAYAVVSKALFLLLLHIPLSLCMENIITNAYAMSSSRVVSHISIMIVFLRLPKQ